MPFNPYRLSVGKTRGKENLSDLLSTYRSAVTRLGESDGADFNALLVDTPEALRRLERHPDVDDSTLADLRIIAKNAGLPDRNAAAVERLDKVDRRLGLDPSRPTPSAATQAEARVWAQKQDTAERALPRLVDVRIPPEMAARINRLGTGGPSTIHPRMRKGKDPEALAATKRMEDAAALSALSEALILDEPTDAADNDWPTVTLRECDAETLVDAAHAAGPAAPAFSSEMDTLAGVCSQIRESTSAADLATVYATDPAAYAERLRARKISAVDGEAGAEPLEIAAARTLTGEDPHAMRMAEDAWEASGGAPEVARKSLESHMINAPQGSEVLESSIERAVNEAMADHEYRNTYGEPEYDGADTSGAAAEIASRFPGVDVGTLESVMRDTYADIENEQGTAGDGENAVAQSVAAQLNNRAGGAGAPTRNQSENYVRDEVDAMLADGLDGEEAAAELARLYPGLDTTNLAATIDRNRQILVDEFGEDSDYVHTEAVDWLTEDVLLQVGEVATGVGEPGYGRFGETDTHVYREVGGRWRARAKGDLAGSWKDVAGMPPSAKLVAPSTAAQSLGGRCVLCGRTLTHASATGYGPKCAAKHR